MASRTRRRPSHGPAPGIALPRVERPVPHAILLMLVVMLGVAVRLPSVFVADDVFHGHADSRLYFQRAEEFRDGILRPLPHGGSGWPLLLAGSMNAFQVPNAEPLFRFQEAPATPSQSDAVLASYAIHMIASSALVVATYALARSLVRPSLALVSAGLVAVDPFLLRHATDVMADAAYAVVLVLAIACVVKARDRMAWLAPAGALMAIAHMMRVNGVVMLGMLVALAWLLLRGRSGFRVRHLAIPVVVFVLVAAPYLAWRAAHLPGPFDYGTNQRAWADDLWDMSDRYWIEYSLKEGGPRETMGEYLASHTASEALSRFAQSIGLQLLDLGVVLSPIALAGIAAALWLRSRSAPLLVFASVLVFTFATFVWIYPLVRSPRYFMPLVPLAAILATWSATQVASRGVAWHRIAVAMFVTYGAYQVIVNVPTVVIGLKELRSVPFVRDIVVVSVIGLILASLAPTILRGATARRRGLPQKAHSSTARR